MLDENLKDKALKISGIILDRFRSRDRIISFIDSYASTQNVGWNSVYLAGGDLGVALTYGAVTEILQTDTFQQTTREYAKHVAQNLESSYQGHIGLFQGLSGVNFTFSFLGRTEPRFLKSLSNIEPELNKVALNQCDYLLMSDSVHSYSYDLISGIVGVGAYFLFNYEHSSQNRDTLQKIINTIVFRVMNLSPLCFATKSKSLIAEYILKYPERANGFVDLGLAHGLSGPLGLLALAGMHGFVDEVGHEAMVKLYQQIMSGVTYVDQTPIMPSFVSLNFDTLDPTNTRTRPAWCYGNLGCARTILLAGIYLKNPQMIDSALELLVPVTQKALVPKNNIYSMLCHGKAGAAQIFWRCIKDLEKLGFGDERLDLYKQALNFLIREVIDDFDENCEFGFSKDIIGETTVPDAGYLTGSSGIALALLSIVSDSDVPWDRPLLIA